MIPKILTNISEYLSTQKIINLIFLMFIMLIIGCSPKLGKQFYTNPEDILFQHYANYMPTGDYLGIATPNYPGVLAVVGDWMIFDTKGQANKPGMKIITSFKIDKDAIRYVELSDKKLFGLRLITIMTETINYYFYFGTGSGGIEVYTLILDWCDCEEIKK